MNGKPFSSQYAVHPHLRGSYQFPRPVPVPHIGSSPPTWGIRCSTSPTIDISRFIPTYVGHTGSAHVFCPPLPVHPHIRGAYVLPASSSRYRSGSSPHTWGIRTPHRPSLVDDRFIPTYVGHTSRPSGFCPGRSVHPHIRGAYEITLSEGLGVLGSSPHTWGIHDSVKVKHDRLRFIPTYVGHTTA